MKCFRSWSLSLALLALAFVSHGFCSSEPLEIVKLQNISQEEIEEFFEGKRSLTAIEFSRGTQLPLQLLLRGDFFAFQSINNSDLVLDVVKTFYVRCVDGEVLFSSDLAEWRDFNDFTTGCLTLTLTISQEQQPSLSVDLELEEDSRSDASPQDEDADDADYDYEYDDEDED